MATGLELKSVRKGKGKVHLTPLVREEGPTRTLCGQEMAAGAAREVDEPADCSICRRRRNDPAAVSSAFFLEDAGERVLELSLKQAEARRQAAPPRLKVVESKPKTPPPPAAAKPPSAPSRRSVPGGEVDTAGLREFSDNVFLGEGGVIVRMERGRLAEIVGEGRFQLLRRGDRLTLRVADVVVEAEVSRVEAHAEDS